MENTTKSIDIEECSSSKRFKFDQTHDVEINELYTTSSFVDTLSEAFEKKTNHTLDCDALITNEPFTCCILPNFINSLEYVNTLKEDINELDVNVLNSDLYQFKQSNDFKSLNISSIESLKEFFHGKLLTWMKKVTKIPLEDKIDISCSCYTYTDHLLCHDDELEGRRIAYIYYIMPEWEKSDGGTLDLFNSVDGQPTDVAKSFVPDFNKFIFFEVGELSFHQVSEILAFKTRTSISGWFYGPPIKRSPKVNEIMVFQKPLKYPKSTLSNDQLDYKEWINETYLIEDTQIEIRESFEESSEIELMTFLKEEKYEELCKVLMDSKICWMKKGPAIRRNYEEALTDSLPDILLDFYNLFCSENFLVLLSNLTGLRLHPNTANKENNDNAMEIGKVSANLRRWNHGSYTLLHSQSFLENPTLLASLHFNCEGWDTEWGGFTSYVGKEEKDELLRVDPKPNSLALVYITPETAHFMKYINCKIKDAPVQGFHDFFGMYQE